MKNLEAHDPEAATMLVAVDELDVIGAPSARFATPKAVLRFTDAHPLVLPEASEFTSESARILS